MERRESERIERQLWPVKLAAWLVGGVALILAITTVLLVVRGNAGAAAPVAALTGTSGVCFVGFLAYRGSKRAELRGRTNRRQD
jgi:hypothetical protein